ncbi:MAG: hypothetical protein HQ518_31795 [Rhodopirellula sp.]|nr:hypothetical protein [Rhodopirellula sp.]
MPTRPKKRPKSLAKSFVSPEQVLEFCRRPSSLLVASGLAVVTVVTIWAFRPGSDSVADSDLTDEQLESDFLALGAVGISDSANPRSGSVNSDFHFKDDKDDGRAELPNFGNQPSFLPHANTSAATPEFEPPFDDDTPRFGRPAIVTDPHSPATVQQAGFQEPVNSPSQVVGARVTANQAVWLTGSIEPR